MFLWLTIGFIGGFLTAAAVALALCLMDVDRNPNGRDWREGYDD